MMATKSKPSAKAKGKSRASAATTKKGLSTSPCTHPCTTVIKLMNNRSLTANNGISSAITNIDGYSYINIYVQFTQSVNTDPSVVLGATFCLDANGEGRARRYVNLEANLPYPQPVNFIEVNGVGPTPYIARFPVMGPFIQVFAYNRTTETRTVNIWAYLVS